MGTSRLARAMVAATFTFAACVGDEPGTTVPGDAAAPLTDAGSPGDSGGEAEASLPSFCARSSPRHEFCADFDTVEIVSAGWDGEKATLGAGASANFGVVPKPPSPPNVVQLAIAPTPAGSPQLTSFAFLDRTLERNGRATATTTFQAVLPSTAPANASDTIRYFGIFVGDVGVALYRYGTGAGWYLLVTGVPKNATPHFLSNLPPVDRWMNVSLSVLFHETNGSITLTFDSVRSVSLSNIATLPPADAGAPAPTLRLNLGPAQVDGPIPAISTLFDDVTLDLR